MTTLAEAIRTSFDAYVAGLLICTCEASDLPRDLADIVATYVCDPVTYIHDHSENGSISAGLHLPVHGLGDVTFTLRHSPLGLVIRAVADEPWPNCRNIADSKPISPTASDAEWRYVLNCLGDCLSAYAEPVFDHGDPTHILDEFIASIVSATNASTNIHAHARVGHIR
jgi:hypothetical protein